jgi:DedD protein
LSPASEDDGFREIQLSGKQLVFLFMAATVVLVVSFLSGVLVGRGVRAERAAEVQADALTESPAASPARPTPETTTLDADPREAGPPPDVPEEPQTTAGAAPAPAIDDAPVAVKRSEPPVPQPPAPAPAAKALASASRPAAVATPPPAKKPEPSRAAASAPAAGTTESAVPSSPSSGPRTGYTVQVAAVDGRAEADTMARRLSGKGYDAYVEQQKGNGKFRIRVGSFKTRRDAQLVADRLKKEEKFKPWVTR